MCADIHAGDTSRPATDDELMAAARGGDTSALETLLVRYQPQLFRFGYRMCGNAEDAGDVAQESLIAMARSLRDFRGDSSISTWLYTIARRFCIRSGNNSAITYASPPMPGAMIRMRIQYMFRPVRSTCTIKPICTRYMRAARAIRDQAPVSEWPALRASARNA